MNIKLRVSIWYTLLMAVIGLASISILYGGMRALTKSTLRNTLISATESACANAEYEHGTFEIDDDDDLAELYPTVALYLYDADGGMLFGSRERLTAPFAEGKPREAASADGTPYLLYDLPLTLNGRDIWVRGVAAKTVAASEIADSITISLLAFPIIVLLAAVGGYFLTRGAFKPVQNITRTARAIADGQDLSLRVGAKGPHDEMYELAETIDRMLERLERAFSAERRFAADASHELRTPLTVILAQCDYALSEDDPAELREALEEIQRSGKRMSRLVEQLLTLTRMDAGGAGAFSPVELSALAETLCRERQRAAGGARIACDAEAGLLVRGDEALLSGLIGNLVDNAVRHGRPNGDVRVTVRKEGGEAVLRVRDDGPGIPPDALPHLFERFYQADASHGGGGAGLGLSLAAEIARRHGAALSAENAEGGGSVFTARFPAL